MTNLKNAPLQEVVFEVRWELDVNPESNILQDDRFDLAVGVFANSLSDLYPDRQTKGMQVQVQNRPLPYTLTHLFRKGDNGWPLVQIGPGIMTVNDREETYSWADFSVRIKTALQKLNEAYSNSLKFNFSSLRYIDSVLTNDYGKTVEWDEFVAEKLNIIFKNLFDTKGKLRHFSLNQIFELSKNNQLLLSVSSGKDTVGDRLIWQTNVYRQQSAELNELIIWVNEVHEEHASPLFKKMLKPDFHASFS